MKEIIVSRPEFEKIMNGIKQWHNYGRKEGIMQIIFSDH
jgi:hypothetical protein